MTSAKTPAAMWLEFPELGKRVLIELDYSRSPETLKAIFDNLPVKVNINRWGDELYTDAISAVSVNNRENAESAVSLFDVAY